MNWRLWTFAGGILKYNQDHGTQGAGLISTPTFQLLPAGNAGNPDAGASGANAANLRQDFGLIDNYYTLGGNIYADYPSRATQTATSTATTDVSNHAKTDQNQWQHQQLPVWRI